MAGIQPIGVGGPGMGSMADMSAGTGASWQGAQRVQPSAVSGTEPTSAPEKVSGTGKSAGSDKTEKTSKAECETCKERKYVDRSDEGNVSFQAPTHVSPGQSASSVMSHEREHVRNAVNEGKEDNKKLVSVSVALKMSVCPECGRSYIAGGTTRTRMLTYRPNPYDQGRKNVEGTFLRGMNLDEAV